MMRCGSTTSAAASAICSVRGRLPSSRAYEAARGVGKRGSSSLNKRSSLAAECSSSHPQPHRRIVVAQPSSSTSPLRGFFTWYSAKLDTHPLTTKCISAGLISSIANILAQAIAFQQDQRSRSRGTSDGSSSSSSSEDVTIQKRHTTTATTTTSPTASIFGFWSEFQVDPHQVGRFAFLNFVFVAPVFHTWYAFLNKAIPGVTWRQVIRRTFWDEFVFSPMYIPVFLSSLWRLEGTEWPTIQTMLVKELPGIVVAEWSLWIPTMLMTFRYAPVKFQVLVINVVGVVWQTFLSFMAARAHNHGGAGGDQHHKEQMDKYLETVVGPDAAHNKKGDNQKGASVVGNNPTMMDNHATSPLSK